jgi:hypothetical protein
MMTASPTNAIATLRIEIKYIEPLIWRRVAVRTSMNLMALHKVIQAAMGWLDYHLWEFIVDPWPDRQLPPNRTIKTREEIVAARAPVRRGSCLFIAAAAHLIQLFC